jgi:hypothetical protein
MACARCEARGYQPSTWFAHLWGLYRLHRAHYRFDPEDLTLEEWQDLGELVEAMDAIKRGGKIG